MILVSDERKITTEGHYEFLDIVDYLLFHNSLIDICKISYADFLSIDKVKKVFILKHVECFDCIAAVLDCYAKV